MAHLVIAVDLVSPSIHVHPEWPPSPTRLHGALAAGAFGRGLPGEGVAAAMRVLEGLPAPWIRVPDRLGKPAGAVVSVPHNQADVAMRDRVPAGRPDSLDARMAKHRDLRDWSETLLNGHGIAYAYPVPAGARRAVEDAMPVLDAVARSLYALGRHMDAASASATLSDGPLPDHGTWWRPDPGGGTDLRVPMAGAYDEYVAIHPETAEPDAGVVRYMPRPSRWASTAYLAPGALPVGAPTRLALDLRDAKGRQVAFANGDRASLARAVAALGVPDGVDVLPVPTVGGPHVDGLIRRLLVVAPDMRALADARYALADQAVEVGRESGSLSVVLATAADDSPVFKHYTCIGGLAASVAPVLVRASGDASDAALSAAVVATLPDDVRGLVDTCEVSLAPNEPWARMLSPKADNAGLCRRHVRIVFRRAVQGPLRVGERTSQGFGLLRLHQLVTTRRYLLSGPGLPNLRDAVRLADAFRRAALARAGALGLVPSSALTGREPDGSPLPTPGEGRQGAHACWMSETEDMPASARGRVRAIVVHADMGLSGDDVRAMDAVSRLWTDEVATCPDGGWVVTPTPDERSPLTGGGRTWVSTTPHLTPSHVRHPDKAVRALRETLARLHGMDRDAVHVERLPDRGLPLGQAMLSCCRGRKHPAPDRVGAYYRISMPGWVDGPLSLGALRHWGMGQFVPVPDLM